MPFFSKPLNWDTAFFGFAVTELSGYGDGLSFVGEIEKAKSSGVKLIYWRWKGPMMPEFSLPEGLRIFNSGRKLLFEKKPQQETENLLPVIHLHEGVCNNDLIQLALAAGNLSRFKTDPDMPDGAFYKMYRQWMENSVNGIMADKVYVAEAEGIIMGMITLKQEDHIATIGLFSVNEKFRHKGLGTALLISAEQYAAENGCEKIIVTTQEHSPAVDVYQKNNFIITGSENIFHIWL